MKWLRFYHDVLTDPKVQDMRPALFKFWVNLLCVASQQPERGTLPSDASLMLLMHVNRKVLTDFLRELEALGIIEWTPGDASVNVHRRVTDAPATRRRIHNWEERQRPSDDVAQRVREHRERVKLGPCNVTVTALDRDREEEEKTPLPPGGGNSRPHEAEPSRSPLEAPPPEPKAVAPIPALSPLIEVERVAARAEQLFPACNHDKFVYELAGEYPIAWIDAALTRASDQQRGGRPYLRGILRGYQVEGGPRSAAVPASRATPPPEPTESKADRIRRFHKALGLPGEPLTTLEEVLQHDKELRDGRRMVRHVAGGTPPPTSWDAAAGDRQRSGQELVSRLAAQFQSPGCS